MTTMLEAAAARNGMPYALPPDGTTTIDCSLYAIQTARDADSPLPPGVRSAEQIRQALPSIDLDAVEPGDFLFFERTYQCPESPGPDGRLATHVGISLGRGTMKMWDANDARRSVGITNIGTPYWQSRLIGAGRAPSSSSATPAARGPRLHLTAAGVRLRAAPNAAAEILIDDLGLGAVVTATGDHAWREVVTGDGGPGSSCGWVATDWLAPVPSAEPAEHPDVGLSMEPEHQFAFEELWPSIQYHADEYGADPQVMAGIIEQESTRRNLRVHPDRTGHGLAGLDDHGLLPDFEHWSGLTIGRGPTATIIPPGMQIAYLAKTLAEYAAKLGGTYPAARAWHRGEAQWEDAAGDRYEALIRGHVTVLFGDGWYLASAAAVAIP